MTTVAVTGGMGSGKSTVCSACRAMRIPVLSADDLSKEIADTVPAVRKRIVDLLGAAAFATDGLLDRKYVAARVFGNPRTRKKLEAILHPVVLARVRTWFAAQRRKRKKLAIVEAALVYESGLDAMVDIVLVIDAPREERVNRIQKRDGSTKAAIRRRMKAQMSDHERRRRADVVIHNNGRLSALLRKTRSLIQILRQESK